MNSQTKDESEFYNRLKTVWISDEFKDMTVIKDSIDMISTSSIQFSIKQNELIHSCKVISYKYGLIRVLFDNQPQTKYKNKTNIGENLELKPFTNFKIEENRIIAEIIDDEEIKLNLDIDAKNLCHEYSHKKTQTYKLEIILSPFFMINYYNNDILISSINRNKKLAVLTEQNFSPNSIDFTTYNASSVHGLPERLSSFSLRDDAYRLYNLDAFDQVIGSPKSLYGSIPMLHHVIGSGDCLFTIFINNSSETWVEIETSNEKEKMSTWSTEGGVLDIYLLSDCNFHKIFYKIATLTGFAPMAPIFSLGYHHCRWGFISQDDITEVDDLMTKYDIPYDVFWLDIDHTDKKHYFTWDKINFPNMENFVKNLKDKERHLVTIIDPHLSTNEEYEIARTLIDNKCLILKNVNCEIKDSETHEQEVTVEDKELLKTSEETEDMVTKTKLESLHFVGHCWPGASFYADFINYEQILPIWNKFFKNENYFLNSDIIHTWIDMNEPSVFNQPEITMPKNCLHFDGEITVPHYEVHNIYGHNYHRVTYDSLKNRYEGNIRPFILSRSFYAGSQQYGFIWTGDNKSTWEFMKVSMDMLMSISICGLSACGADVGGFFGDPSEELLSSWYELGVFYPFFRGHSHNEAKRREPWNFSEQTMNSIRNSVRLKYKLLLYFYTKFFEYSLTGIPICKPPWLRFPGNYKFYGDVESYSHMMIGDEFLVIPYLEKPKAIELDFEHSGFYDFNSGQILVENLLNDLLINDYEEKKLTLLVVAGSVIPWTEDIGFSSKSVMKNPLSILIFPDQNKFAKGKLYLDDGKSFNYQKGDYEYMNFHFENNKLVIKSIKTGKSPLTFDPVLLEKIQIYGYGKIIKEGIKNVKLNILEDFIYVNKQNLEKDFREINLDFEILKTSMIIKISTTHLKIPVTTQLSITLEY